MQRLHASSFYLYGVIVALSIREVFVRVGPHLFIQSSVEPWQIRLETARLILFLTTITCFYIGSCTFFDKVYLNTETEKKYAKKVYGLDFGFGLVHFTAFFGWSLTVTDHSRQLVGVGSFLWFLAAIFLYDLIWLLANCTYDTRDEIKMWALMGLVSTVIAGILFFIVKGITGDVIVAEYWALSVMFLYVMGDLIELFKGKPFFSQLLTWFASQR